MGRRFRIVSWVAGALVALVLGVASVSAQSTEVMGSERQALLFDRLYNRAKRISEVEYTRLSERVNLLWMAYLADESNPAVLWELGKIYGSWLNEPVKGVPLLQGAFENSGYDYYIGMDLFQLAASARQWEIAEETTKRLLEERPDNLFLLAGLVSIYEESLQTERALTAVRKLRDSGERSKDNPAFVFKEAELLRALEQTPEAEQLLTDYMSNNPNEPTSVAMLAALYMEDQDFESANELLEDAMERIPESPEIIDLAVASYAMQQRYSEVGKQILQAARIEGVEPEFVESLIATAKRMSPNLTAVTEALIPVQVELTELFPMTDRMGIALANDHFVLRDTLQGETVLRGLVEQGTQLPSPYYYFVQKYAAAEDTTQLRTLVDEGLLSIPEDGLLNLYSALLDIQGGDSIGFANKVNHALEVVPSTDRMYGQLSLMKAEVEMQNDDWESAKKYFEVAIAEPNPLAYNNYAYALAIHGTREDLNQAEDLARKAVQMNQNEPSHLDTYAWVLYLKGAYPLARIYMEQALEHMEEPEAVYYEHYAEILMGLESYDEAIEAWQELLLLGDEEQKALAEEKLAELRENKDNGAVPTEE